MIKCACGKLIMPNEIQCLECIRKERDRVNYTVKYKQCKVCNQDIQNLDYKPDTCIACLSDCTKTSKHDVEQEIAKHVGKDYAPSAAVHHPSHYCRLQPEPIDVINNWGLGFNLGNAVKYISRAGHKDDAVQDLEKAIFYINYEIKMMKDKKT